MNSIAWRNFLRQGTRSFLNVFISACSIIAVVFMLSLLNGFQAQATRNLARTDVGGGQYRVPGFDLLTPTKWEDYGRQTPERFRDNPKAVELLILQGELYPNNRLFPVQLRGVEMGQIFLDLPLEGLEEYGSEMEDFIPVVLGVRMAKKAHLRKGDQVILKWRDKFGAVDARGIVILDVARMVNPRIDEGVVWLRLDHLRKLTRRPAESSWITVPEYLGPEEGMEFHSPERLMADLFNLLRHDRRNSRILWFILVFLAGISIFNTQILNVFKRQKEIGTLMALGMTANQVTGLFVREGVWAALGALVTAALFGIPFFVWFQGVGFDVSHLSESTIPVQEKIFLAFDSVEIASCVGTVFIIMILVAWLPVRKISRLDPTRALRGKAIA